MTEEDKKYRQGRRKEQVEGHAKAAMIGILGLLVILFIIGLSQ